MILAWAAGRGERQGRIRAESRVSTTVLWIWGHREEKVMQTGAGHQESQSVRSRNTEVRAASSCAQSRPSGRCTPGLGLRTLVSPVLVLWMSVHRGASHSGKYLDTISNSSTALWAEQRVQDLPQSRALPDLPPGSHASIQPGSLCPGAQRVLAWVPATHGKAWTLPPFPASPRHWGYISLASLNMFPVSTIGPKSFKKPVH